MTTILFRMLLLALALAVASSAMTASDKEKYEAKGLSMGEWQMIVDSRMTEQKVDELLKAGISIVEYFRYPWLTLGMTEKEWIKNREAGLMDRDLKIDISVNRANNKDWAVVQNFFLPGMHQFRRGQTLKGVAMTLTAVVTAGLCVGLSAREGAVVSEPLLVLVPDMLWSSIDIGVQISKERNPTADRFSVIPVPKPYVLASVDLALSRRK